MSSPKPPWSTLSSPPFKPTSRARLAPSFLPVQVCFLQDTTWTSGIELWVSLVLTIFILPLLHPLMGATAFPLSCSNTHLPAMQCYVEGPGFKPLSRKTTVFCFVLFFLPDYNPSFCVVYFRHCKAICITVEFWFNPNACELQWHSQRFGLLQPFSRQSAQPCPLLCDTSQWWDPVLLSFRLFVLFSLVPVVVSS